jgi:hypothetical protein
MKQADTDYPQISGATVHSVACSNLTPGVYAPLLYSSRHSNKISYFSQNQNVDRLSYGQELLSRSLTFRRPQITVIMIAKNALQQTDAVY